MVDYVCEYCGEPIWDILDLKEYQAIGQIAMLCTDCSKKFVVVITRRKKEEKENDNQRI